MMTWLIFAAWAEDDLPLWNSHWIARQTARLAASPPRVIERAEATREALEEALANEETGGLALFGHGRPDAILGSDGREALDLANLHLLKNRWAHAIACNAGRELVPAGAHADVFVGYDVSLIVEWTLEDLPEALRDRIAHMVTATTLGLVEGLRSRVELQRRAEIAAEAVVVWLLENTDEGYLGIHILAQQLVQNMIVRP